MVGSSRYRALIWPQAGPGAVVLTVAPTSFFTKIALHLFRVMLLRRFRLPLPLSLHMSQCGRPIDSFGHHLAACARAGVLGRRGFVLESVAARICSERHFQRDGARFGFASSRCVDSRRLEVVA